MTLSEWLAGAEVGAAEEALPLIAEALAVWKASPGEREKLLEALSRVPYRWAETDGVTLVRWGLWDEERSVREAAISVLVSWGPECAAGRPLLELAQLEEPVGEIVQAMRDLVGVWDKKPTDFYLIYFGDNDTLEIYGIVEGPANTEIFNLYLEFLEKNKLPAPGAELTEAEEQRRTQKIEHICRKYWLRGYEQAELGYVFCEWLLREKGFRRVPMKKTNLQE